MDKVAFVCVQKYLAHELQQLLSPADFHSRAKHIQNPIEGESKGNMKHHSVPLFKLVRETASYNCAIRSELSNRQNWRR